LHVHYLSDRTQINEIFEYVTAVILFEKCELWVAPKIAIW